MKGGIVIHSMRLVYWWVPKCACTTMKKFFAEREGLEGDPHYVKFETTFEEITGYYNFAYVRNPIARIVSLYRDKIKTNFSNYLWEKHKAFTSDMSFEHFMMELQKLPPDRHWMQQVEQIPMWVYKVPMENDLLLKTLPQYQKSNEVAVEVTPGAWKLIQQIYKDDIEQLKRFYASNYVY